MKRGYIRVSTKKQEHGTSLEDQRATLEAEGCEKFYVDTFSGVTMDRPEFKRLCSELESGDTVMFTKLDRVARTETEAYELVMGWVQQRVKVHVLNLGLIEDTPTGRLMLHVMLAFAEFERDMIRERMQAGRAYRRMNDPDYRDGRKPKFKPAQLDHAIELLKSYSYSEVARMTGISKSTLVREAGKRGFRKSHNLETTSD